MNYQSAVGSGFTGLDEGYRKSCSFLKACKDKANTLGLPFDLESSDQGNYKSIVAKEFKACTLVNQYPLIRDRFKKEVTENGKICGVPVKDALGI
jgi:hypothetical protein